VKRCPELESFSFLIILLFLPIDLTKEKDKEEEKDLEKIPPRSALARAAPTRKLTKHP
jgi:hypothetical protein